MTPLYLLDGIRVSRQGHAILQIDRLEIPDAGITAIVGPNGAGKSTALELLALLCEPQAGEVHFKGEKVEAALRERLRRRVGLVPQNPFLFDRSVAGNVEAVLKMQRHPAAEIQERTNAVLAQFGLAPLAARHVRSLSGGEAQKLAIARMLALQPEVLLLDEPFTYLDTHAADELAALIEALPVSGGTQVIFSTHDQSLAARLGEQVIGLIDGRAQAGVLFNHFTGRMQAASHTFDTGRLQIFVADHITAGTRVVIDPAHIVLSTRRLESSMRNEFPGRVAELAEQSGEVRVSIDAGERLHALVTHETVRTLGLSPGAEVWVGFKANAVTVC